MRFFNILSRSFVEQRIAEIKAEGRDKVNRRWREWNRRRMKAQAEGRRFHEPPLA